MPSRGKVQHELFRRRMIARTLIRLKHRLNAEDELNTRMDELDRQFTKHVHDGEIPSRVNVDEGVEVVVRG